MLIEEELVFTKFAPSVKLQKESGTWVANDKLNSIKLSKYLTTQIPWPSGGNTSNYSVSI